MTNNKIKYLILITFPLTVLVVVLLYYNQIKSVLFNFRVPKNVSRTGAILTTPTAEEINKSSQLYNLLDMGIVTTENFILTPISKKRVFEVKIFEPTEINKGIFFEWIRENGYEDIDSSKFIFSN